MYSNNLNDIVNNRKPFEQDHDDLMIESKRCQQTNSRVNSQASLVTCGGTNPQPLESHNTILCTCDITNVYYHDCSDNSDTYYV